MNKVYLAEDVCTQEGKMTVTEREEEKDDPRGCQVECYIVEMQWRSI